MIGYLEGRIIHSHSEGILLLAGSVGYEVLLSPVSLSRVAAHLPGDDDISVTAPGSTTEAAMVRLFIYFHVTERQPKPVLIGFPTLEEKAFFQLFITVAAIGPMKAVKALVRPVGEVAAAIEQKDIASLSKLPGIGKRTAEKIVATLHGKTIPFAVPPTFMPEATEAKQAGPDKKEILQQVADVLVEQLGHSAASARRMIQEALNKNPDIDSAERLFDAIYQENA